MKGLPITQVETLPMGILKVDFDTGNYVMLDMTPRFNHFRFSALQRAEVWRSVDTDGAFIHWYRGGMVVAELAYNEIIKMILGDSY
jgi:hypothetical protein